MPAPNKSAPDNAGHSAAHTPGPWEVKAIPNERGNRMDTWLIYGPYRAVIAQPGHLPHRFADAQLIAAAPEMLAALKKARGAITALAPWDGVNAEASGAQHAIDRAIRKAEAGHD